MGSTIVFLQVTALRERGRVLQMNTALNPENAYLISLATVHRVRRVHRVRSVCWEKQLNGEIVDWLSKESRADC